MKNTPETDALKNLYENSNRKVTTQDVWELCEAFEITAAQYKAERDEANAYADKLAQGFPVGMLPKDIEVLRDANFALAAQIAEMEERMTDQTHALKEIYNVSVFDWDTMPEESRKKYRKVVLDMADKALTLN